VKYYYDTQAWLPKNAVLVSQKAFDALDKATQGAVLKAAADAEARGWKTSEEKTKVWVETAEEERHDGDAVPSPQLKADMKKVGDTMIAEWQKSAGADGQAVLDAYRK
jgi:TRAP-type C4-dicarboxylate transport system substrate-binding protein